MFVALLGAVAVVVFLVAQRSREVFVISVRQGRALVVRGPVPAAFLADVESVVARPPRPERDDQGRAGGAPRPPRRHGDIDERQVQRLRNVFGLRPMAQLRSARRLGGVEHPSAGQLLGIAWLAWMLDRR